MFERSLKEYNRLICAGISAELGCEVVKSNTAEHVPAYPYVSFTVTGIRTRQRTYADDDSPYVPAQVTYSWTVQSDDDGEAFDLAQKLHDWFEETGRLYLKDNGMVFTDVGGITERDNLITVEYEYRKGFDCVLNLMNYVGRDPEVIETFSPEKE